MIELGVDVETADTEEPREGNQFVFNTDDGTISPKGHDDLCGTSTMTNILVVGRIRR